MKKLILFLLVPFLSIGQFNPIFFSGGRNLNNKLVSYYKFDSSPNESTGLSPNGNPTGVDYVTGIQSNAVRFDAATDRVDFADDPNFSFTSGGGVDLPFSMSAWVYFTGFSSGGNWIANKVALSNGLAEWAMVLSSSGSLAFIKYDRTSFSISQSVSTNSFTFSLNTWYHIVVTDNGSKTASGMKIYINKTLQSVSDTSAGGTYTGMNNGVSIMRLGLNSWDLSSPNDRHQGYIDEYSIWKNRTLTVSEISYLYNLGLGRTYPF